MKAREDAARFIEHQLYSYNSCSREKGHAHHYGLQELRELMDFIYGENPSEVECIRNNKFNMLSNIEIG